jgi:hypothetical protein
MMSDLSRETQIARIRAEYETLLVASEAREKRLREALVGIKRAGRARMDSYGDEHSFYFYTASAALEAATD